MNQQQELATWLALWRLPGIGPASFHQLRRAFPELASVTGAASTALTDLSLPDQAKQSLKAFSQGRDKDQWRGAEADLAWLEASDEHFIVTCDDTAYPQLLGQLERPPPLLFVKGLVDQIALPQLAIVGSRHCSSTGKRHSSQFAEHFAAAGFVVTSGLALGVDAAAHEGALAAGGGSIAVLAHGLDHLYPPRHRCLAQRMVAQGALVSAYPIGVKPRPEYFPQRNRIISGLCLGVLVVEAARQSGSLITAYEATDQGREVFAIPGNIQDPLAAGCHDLIRRGATLVDAPDQVVAELASLLGTMVAMPSTLSAGEGRLPNPVGPSGQQRAESDPLSGPLALVLAGLTFQPLSMDQLLAKLPLSAEELGIALVELELLGDVERSGDGFVRCR